MTNSAAPAGAAASTANASAIANPLRIFPPRRLSWGRRLSIAVSVTDRAPNANAVAPRASLRKHRLLRQARGLGQAQHDVHVLHRLAGGTLHQIVDRRDEDG